MSIDLSDCELPSLDTIFGLQPILNSSRRRSPRKHNASDRDSKHTSLEESNTLRMSSNLSMSISTRVTPIKRSPVQSLAKQNVTMNELGRTKHVPSTRRKQETNTARSENKISVSSRERVVSTADIQSLTTPFTRLNVKEYIKTPRERSHAPSEFAADRSASDENEIDFKVQTNAGIKNGLPKSTAHYASRFFLSEARCNDDSDESNDSNEDDEDTDLSGFIVDDNAELSYHESSNSDFETQNSRRKQTQSCSRPRRKLYRGRPTRGRGLSASDFVDSDKENDAWKQTLKSSQTSNATQSRQEQQAYTTKIDYIDLTSSPEIKSQSAGLTDAIDIRRTHETSRRRSDFAESDISNLMKDFDQIMKLTPPTTGAIKIDQPKLDDNNDLRSRQERPHIASTSHGDAFETPPATPPRSPFKLKSPKKLLSPSKQTSSRPPHRPSTDGFWDLGAINDWHDQYSPKKVPVNSPKKLDLTRFQIWSDSEDDQPGRCSDGLDSLPSPCTSPRKKISRSSSPCKSPEKAEKARKAEEKKATIARKRDFDARKENLAKDLFQELDSQITASKLETLASSTGGVKIIWSKTLRSTAGRANWKRTITKLSGSPVKGPNTGGSGVKVQHHANIELAEKVIDCEERLVNTLAHEFCHLANFMVSDVRDQPHGASFKAWASKVTTHLRSTDNHLWNQVEVTTKHSYEINHKYLWVCTGRDISKAMEFLNIVEDEGCGAEYGRHSKSIDPDRHRCGRCKGRLLQVRPKPRNSPKKKSTNSASKGDDGLEISGKMVEIVELSD